jgi:hypothetical protein
LDAARNSDMAELTALAARVDALATDVHGLSERMGGVG